MHPDHDTKDNHTAPRAAPGQSPGKRERGAVATEMVIAVPLLLLLLLLIVQFALAWHAQHIAQTAASKGLAVTRVQGGSTAAGRAQVVATLGSLGHSVLLDPHVTVVRTRRTATIEVHGRVEPVVPGFHLTVAAHDAGAVERWSSPVEKG